MRPSEIHEELKRVAAACGENCAAFLGMNTRQPDEVGVHVFDGVSNKIMAEAWANDFSSVFTKLRADIALRKAAHPTGRL